MNTSIQSEVTQLRSADGQALALHSVHIEGRLEGLMLVMKSRHSYRNDTTCNLETVYTFPLPWGATLLALNAEIAGHRLVATVMEKKLAAARYEQAIDDGDTPIMVEQSARGLYTANLGNLQPGEQAVIEVEHAQLLRFEQGQIRITVPTTVAPRYGNAHAAGGLAAHESVDASLLAHYPLTVQILLTGDVARGAVQSPSHAVATTAREDGTLVSLTQGGFLDRDVVLLIDGLHGASFATVVPDGDAFAVLASFCPAVTTQRGAPLRLKVLVDCSGSMAGDSIQAARSALHEVLKELAPEDRISYSRFGFEVVHDMLALQPCDAVTIRAVANLVAQTNADLGGTEMNRALISTFALGEGLPSRNSPARTGDGGRHTDVLLITDGEVWAVDDVLRSAQRSGHRVFAIGVGSSPAESLLRDLADQTGGACELVSPNQDIAAVILRMARRLRTPRIAGVQVDWGQDAAWQSEIPQYLFGGDTVHAFARLRQNSPRAPVLSWFSGESREQASATRVDAGAGDTLARMLGATQLASPVRSGSGAAVTDALAERVALALRYQLVTDQTNLILVHVREEGHKATGLPELAHVASMQAAGWGAAGSVMPAATTAMPSFCRTQSSKALFGFDADDMEPFASLDASEVRRGRTMAAGSTPFSTAGMEFPRRKNPSILQQVRQPPNRYGAASPLGLLQTLDAHGQMPRGAALWVDALDALGVPKKLAQLVEDMMLVLGARKQAWGIVLHWLQQELVDEFTLSRQAARMLRNDIKAVDAATLARWTAALTQALGPVRADGWGNGDAAP